MTLAPTIQKYILHWGEMGTRWGVNRTVAQIHALLFLSNQPLPEQPRFTPAPGAARPRPARHATRRRRRS